MIQRIQTIYLLLTIILAILFLTGNIINFQDGKSVSLSGIETTSGEVTADQMLSTWPLTVLSIAVPLIALATIFLYRKRTIQMKFTLLLILLIIMLIGAVGYFAMTVIRTFKTGL